ncbi:MAG: hypothetical protein ACRERC_18745 [Candidatus Binatia bacterium]
MQKSMLGHAAPGATVVYAITVANTGQAPTTDPITVVDDLPAGVVFQQVNAVGWSCAPAPPMVTCTYAAALAPGQLTPPIRITVIIDAPTGTQLINVAVANSGEMSASGDNATRVAGPAAPAPLLSPLGLLAALGALIAVARRAARPH